MIKALITGAGAVLGQGIIKALRRSSLPVEILAADPNPLSTGLFWADKGYRIPLANEPGYMDRITDILETERPDILLVGTDVELAAFAKHREALEAGFGTRIVVSRPEVIAIADDKYRTFQFLDEVGLHPPLSALPEDEGALGRLVEAVGFPLIVKPRVGARSVGVSIASDEKGLRQALQGRSGLVVQECVGGPDAEYTSSVLVFDERPLASIVMRRDLRDGNTYRAYAGSYEELNAFVRQAGAALDPYGPANFQFRTDARGRPRVFEINARFSGATPLRALVGFNEVEMCIRRILFDEDIVQPSVQPATILRHLSETLVTQDDLERIR